MAVERTSLPNGPKHAKFAADHGVKIAIEMHPGFVGYSPETMLKLRSIAGPSIGCNYDPSHMFWKGIDPFAAVRELGDSIFHVHAKDTRLYGINLPLTGVLDTKSYKDERNAPGFSAQAATVTAQSGGKNSSPRCACSATTTCSPSSTRTACSRRTKA